MLTDATAILSAQKRIDTGLPSPVNVDRAIRFVAQTDRITQ